MLPAATADMTEVLETSRSSPLPSAPDAPGSEPIDFIAVLHGASVPGRFPGLPVPPTPMRPDVPFHDLGVGELLHAYASGRAAVVDVLSVLRTRWDRTELAPGAVLAVIDGLDELAAEADRRWRSGTARPLEGVFFGVKDMIDVAGAPVTAGSVVTGDRIATRDAVVVARLRAAGAIPALITATTEFACGAPVNARYGVVRNPWDTDRWTGGSSTGSAGALAAGLVPFALGTDTGGSIRVPSALCGLSGLKPTYGLVPRTGVVSLAWSLDHVGPMARCADDLRLVLPHLLGTDAGDATGSPTQVWDQVRSQSLSPDRRPSVGAQRVGVPTRWFTDLCDSGVRQAWHQAIGRLATAGVEIVDVDLPSMRLIHDELTVILTSELASNQEAVADRFADHDLGMQVRIVRGGVPSAVDYLRALRRRAGALRDTIAAFDAGAVDLLITPGVGGVAPELSDLRIEVDGDRIPMQAMIGRNTGPFDYLGLPAVMIPAGTSAGLPVGMQIVGRPWADDAVLGLASVFQTLTTHHQRRFDDR
nr:amidase [Gordonia desulfuricans]